VRAKVFERHQVMFILRPKSLKPAMFLPSHKERATVMSAAAM
jgi:hypothetical protein